MKTRIALATAITPAAFAAESANYTLTPLAPDAGGRSTSASYILDSATSRGGAASSPGYAARHGYAGSLYDAAGLTLNASPLTVNEGASLQLHAFLTFDDATFLTVPAASVAWSTVSGPLTISTGGLVTGSAVYQNTSATAQGLHLGFTGTLDLTVVNTLPDNFGSYAADGITDSWQVQYFGLSNPNAAPLLDPDRDGFDNRFEFNAGIIPTDPLSVFHWRIEPVAGQPGQRNIIFSPRLAGRTYTVKSSTSLLDASWISLSGATVTDNGNERTVTDPNAAGERKFYRVDISQP